MANFWFTAGFHLGRANIIRYCNRPLSSAVEMDETNFRTPDLTRKSFQKPVQSIAETMRKLSFRSRLVFD